MFSANDAAYHIAHDQVSVTVVRKSDGQSLTFVLDEKTHIHDLKQELKRLLKPQFDQGCRLIFRDKVLKGRHTLKHYGIKKGVNDQAISSRLNDQRTKNKMLLLLLFFFVFLFSVDDTKDWKSSSSSSDTDDDK